MRLSVKEKLANTLSDFAQSKSDAVTIEAGEFERLEKDYKEYMADEKGEPFIIDLIELMCYETLTPSLYNYWLIIKHQLSANRIGLVEDNQFISEAIKAKDVLASETLRYLKLIVSNSDADTPDLEDALNCCHLD